jgi:hypothetical protein
MSELLQFIIVVAFGALYFGCGYLTASVVTRNKRSVAGCNPQTGTWEWGCCQAAFFTRFVAAYPPVLLHVAIAAMP